jgi:hypothetical protein
LRVLVVLLSMHLVENLKPCWVASFSTWSMFWLMVLEYLFSVVGSLVMKCLDSRKRWARENRVLIDKFCVQAVIWVWCPRFKQFVYPMGEQTWVNKHKNLFCSF